MTTISVLDAVGATQTIAKVADTGQALEADCLPVVLPALQLAAIASETTLDAVKTATEALAVDPPTETTLAAMSASTPVAVVVVAPSASVARYTVMTLEIESTLTLPDPLAAPLEACVTLQPSSFGV